MKFVENEMPEPTFTLTLNVREAVALYKIVSKAEEDGVKEAQGFADALNWFAANSNDYTEYL